MTSHFSDVEAHWAQDCIHLLNQKQIIQGYPDGTFRPETTITRAEFAALIQRAFPKAAVVRSPLIFSDVPTTHWAHAVIQWAYERGFFSGYPDQTFQPNQPIPRVQAVTVLVNARSLDLTQAPLDLLPLYFEDAAEIPDYGKSAIAAAIIAEQVVNYPEVRQLAPNRAATRAETAALLCAALQMPETIPTSSLTRYLPLTKLKGDRILSLAELKTNAFLLAQIQAKLGELGLYRDQSQLRGQYSPELEAALIQFCDVVHLSNMQTGQFGASFAQALLNLNVTELKLMQAQDRTQVFQTFLDQETGFNAEKLAFLDRGIEKSPYKAEIPAYPTRLTRKPDGKQLAAQSKSTDRPLTELGFNPYPNRGQRPPINASGLDFLHPDIQQACLCLGSWSEGQLQTRWLGRNATQNVELWSTTKIIPLLNVIAQANTKAPTIPIAKDTLRNQGGTERYDFYTLAVDAISYSSKVATSNAIAHMFKLFETPSGLEQWVKQLTGNSSLTFQGRYGEPPFMTAPELVNPTTQTAVLKAKASEHRGQNSISTYDLTRLLSMVGWHYHLSPSARIPGAQWHSLETLIRALGTDTARYLDIALSKLGLEKMIESPVLLSKLGFGRSSIRDRTELGYTAFAQWVDQRPTQTGQPAVLRTFCFTLLSAKDLNDPNQEARELDARMAAEVTELVRRIVLEEI